MLLPPTSDFLSSALILSHSDRPQQHTAKKEKTGAALSGSTGFILLCAIIT
jgi:hypothetical protein